MQGSRFLVTILDLVAHFPLAYSVNEHTALEVAKCLMHAFSLFGFLREVLSDQTRELLSQMMEVFLKECNVSVTVLWRDFIDV